jgi:hypothetical protein
MALAAAVAFLRPAAAAAAAAAGAGGGSGRTWRQIPGVPGYLVSTCGLIKNAQTQRELRQSIMNTGYKCVSIRGRTMTVHRVVAMAWIPNPASKATVNHRDRDRANNGVWNLEWATGSEQNRDRAAWERLPSLDGADLPGEEWHPIGERRRQMEVSNLGRVRRGGRVMQYTQRGEPYLCVKVDGKKQYLHRLVAALFVPNPLLNNVVNHMDGDTRNNAASNLEWCTASENTLHAQSIGRKQPRRHPVDQLDLETGRLIRRFESQTEAARETGVPLASINVAARGRSHAAGGFAWRSSSDSSSSDSSSDSD